MRLLSLYAQRPFDSGEDYQRDIGKGILNNPPTTVERIEICGKNESLHARHDCVWI